MSEEKIYYCYGSVTLMIESLKCLCVLMLVAGPAFLLGCLFTLPDKPLRNFRKRVMCVHCQGTGRK